MINKLKPCPFCKEKPEVIEEKLWSERGHGYYGKYMYYISCINPKCKVRPRTKIGYDTIYGKTKEQCVEQASKDWNKRGMET